MHMPRTTVGPLSTSPVRRPHSSRVQIGGSTTKTFCVLISLVSLPSRRDHRDPFCVWNHGGSIAVKTTVIHDPQMSREDPQFKLRMPAELRAQAEQAAKASGRSLNSELVARIESSFLSDGSADRLIPAARAKELALMARSGIPDEIRRRAVASIGKAIRLGHNEAFVVIDDLELGVGIADAELDELLNVVKGELENAGYVVSCDDIEAMHVKF